MTTPSPEIVVKHLIRLMGGHEKAFKAFDADFHYITTRWEQDTATIGRILRAHLFVEHFLTEFIQLRNPSLALLTKPRFLLPKGSVGWRRDRRYIVFDSGNPPAQQYSQPTSTYAARGGHRRRREGVRPDRHVPRHAGREGAARVEGREPEIQLSYWKSSRCMLESPCTQAHPETLMFGLRRCALLKRNSRRGPQPNPPLERTAAAVYFTCGRASRVRRRGRSTALRWAHVSMKKIS